MQRYAYPLLATLLLVGFLDNGFGSTRQTAPITEHKQTIDSNSDTTEPSNKLTYQELYHLVVYGQAKLNDIHEGFKTNDTGEIVNLIHALYSMRWHQGVHRLLDDMWTLNKKNYPDLSWQIIEKIPVRIAIASTINRIKIFDTGEYKSFIRSHKYDEHEFHRAQVIIALGLNGHPQDINYLEEMADSDSIYVSQSAITALGIINHQKAKKTLIKLANKYKNTQRGLLIIEILDKAYAMIPTEKPSTIEIKE